jgi:hypothetical protein
LYRNDQRRSSKSIRNVTVMIPKLNQRSANTGLIPFCRRCSVIVYLPQIVLAKLQTHSVLHLLKHRFSYPFIVPLKKWAFLPGTSRATRQHGTTRTSRSGGQAGSPGTPRTAGPARRKRPVGGGTRDGRRNDSRYAGPAGPHGLTRFAGRARRVRAARPGGRIGIARAAGDSRSAWTAGLAGGHRTTGRGGQAGQTGK